MTEIRLRCSRCEKTLKVPEEYGGRVVACPACKQKLRVPEVIMEATLVEDEDEEIVLTVESDPDQDVAVAVESAEPETEAKPDGKLAPVEWVAALMLVGPILAPVWAIQRNPKWKLMAALSLCIYCVTGAVLFAQKDRITAWYRGDKLEVAKSDKPDSGLVSGKSTYRDTDVATSSDDDDDSMPVDEGGYDEEELEAERAEIARRAAEALRRQQEAAEAMQGPPPEEDLLNMDPIRQRAYRANVRIDVLGFGLGSGVVCELEGGKAMILTNRHVIDPDFEHSGADTVDPSSLPTLQVTYIDGSKLAGQVRWVADNRIDLAIVEADSPKEGVRVADWRELPRIKVGERCFAVGNPAGLGWTMTQGSVSALRLRKLENVDVPIVQTDASINRGNSGGGLYNSQGQLIGINNFIINPELAQNAGFAIRAEYLQVLKPDGLKFAE